ncbi:MAG: GGDEF domain-containing protein [Candidatus Obscuribacterales bacterium]|nr:GGDEF domain-containing protein [Steroidobacteraceae bacterium]
MSYLTVAAMPPPLQSEPSQAARVLRAGFRRLRFPEPLEQRFRTDHSNEAHRLVRMSVFVALITTTGFAIIDHTMIKGSNGTPDAIRYGLQLPMLLICLLATSRRFYLKIYEQAIQICAPAFGIGTVLMASYTGGDSTALIGARLLLVTFFCYFMTGMRMNQALRCNCIIVAAMIWVSVAGMIPAGVAAYLGFALLCANVIGGTGAYALERASRTAFLERLTLEELASRDGLTQLLNRQTFELRAQAYWRRASEDQRAVSVLMIDVDYFKRYNDHYGHQAGDECLRRVAQSLRMAVNARGGELLGRYGGEEFIVLLLDRSQSELEAIAHNIARTIANQEIPHAASDAGNFLTVSVGAARHEAPLPVAYSAVAQVADNALYAAKNQGRNRAIVLEAHISDTTDDKSAGDYSERPTSRVQAMAAFEGSLSA